MVIVEPLYYVFKVIEHDRNVYRDSEHYVVADSLATVERIFKPGICCYIRSVERLGVVDALQKQSAEPEVGTVTSTTSLGANELFVLPGDCESE